ncbi:GNAT family N-acetyltransferase [Alkaliphilus transvaalensis]|uniref:GNAT family N-acetyltransferase n=1 Tax=Alkaliphilus transvaalensis TaxID=114628 RepID=UPI00054F44A4|nr:GNAT family N-acetyltransferase [Alkaliphilus transvaalensis]
MENEKITIEKVSKENYHMFDDMVAWRISGVERSVEEKKLNKQTVFSDAYIQLGQQGFYAFAAKVEGRYVGWITMILTPKIGKWHRGIVYVDEVWTAPVYRRKGVAFALMQKAFDVANETNAVKVRLYTDNIPAQRLYEKCGFKVTNHAVFMESNEG